MKLQSMGSLRVGQDWVTSFSLSTFMHWRRKWQPTPVFLPWESQGRGAWWAAVYGVTQSRTRLKRLSSSSSSEVRSMRKTRCGGFKEEHSCWTSCSVNGDMILLERPTDTINSDLSTWQIFSWKWISLSLQGKQLTVSLANSKIWAFKQNTLSLENLYPLQWVW